MPLILNRTKQALIEHAEADGNLEYLEALAVAAQEAIDSFIAAVNLAMPLKANLGDNAFTGIQTFGKSVFQTSGGELAAGAIDVSLANHYKKTIAGIITFSVVNVPAAGKLASFILDLTNGGAFAITWWANIHWAGGVAPTLTAAGKDSLGFYTVDGGATWAGRVLVKDSKAVA